MRAMASSTAFSCLRSSSRRDSVLDLLHLAAEAELGAAELSWDLLEVEDTLVTLLETLD